MRLLIIAFTLLFFAACKNKADKKNPAPDSTTSMKEEQPVRDESSITGVWRPVELSMPMTAERKKELLDSASIEFTADGNYISNFGPETERGTYVYNHTDKLLVTVGPQQREERFAVAWHEGLLTLSTQDEGTIVLQRK